MIEQQIKIEVNYLLHDSNVFGLAIGMLLLNVSEPKAYEPFILVSILLSLALVPILLTKRPAPKFKKLEL